MKILIYGSNGWIGNQFVEILNKHQVEYIKGLSRVDNEQELLKEIEELSPTHIVSFIGRTHGCIGDKQYTTIDYLEQKGKLVDNVRDNLFSPLLLAKISTDKNIHYTYLGTGCIFAYDEEHPFEEEINGFTENSKPNFFGSSYSVVKGFTDRLIKLYANNVLNLRIRMPITGEKNPRNFITKITTYERICSIKNSMTVLPELLPIVLDMMKNKTVGTINLTNPGLISHNEILEMYKEIVDPEFTWTNFTKEEQSKILASDRSNNYLDTTKLETLYPNIMNIKDAVRNCLHKYKQNHIFEKVQNFPESSNLNIFVYCGGKCGSSTLHSTFLGNNYKSIHTHSNFEFMYSRNINNFTIFDAIDYNVIKNKKVYIIDSYRTPIERKISSYFQNISIHCPNYKEKTVEELIEDFMKLFYELEEYHSIDEVMKHYNVKLFDEFDFEKKYVIKEKDNKIFIKIRFQEINLWSKILSEIFEKEIIILNDNLTENKETYELYKEFKNKFKVPQKYMNQLTNDKHFLIFNTKEEQQKYIDKHFK